MKITKNFIWKFKSLPFIYTVHDKPFNHEGIPNALPLELKIDNKTGVLTQVKNPLVEECLRRAYDIGSVVAGVIDEDSGNLMYANDFIDFFKKSLKGRSLQGAKVLEIGSGTGYLLSRIEMFGADVLGVEPGSHCVDSKRKYNVKIINDYFPSKKINDVFDIIIMTNVLEHIPNPSGFLKTLHSFLKDDGLLVLSVPDEEPYITSGDISTLFHEHYSYFTDQTINNVLKVAGFKPDCADYGKYGGVLFRSAIMDDDVSLTSIEIDSAKSLAYKYKENSEINIHKLKTFIDNVFSKGETLGIYVPSRAINLLHVLDINNGIRFFDDNPSLEGKYYPGFNMAVETINNLIDDPVDNVLIFSKSFSSTIKKNIASSIGININIYEWHDFFEGSSLTTIEGQCNANMH